MVPGKHSTLELGKHPAIESELDTSLIGMQTPTVRKKRGFLSFRGAEGDCILFLPACHVRKGRGKFHFFPIHEFSINEWMNWCSDWYRLERYLI